MTGQYRTELILIRMIGFLMRPEDNGESMPENKEIQVELKVVDNFTSIIERFIYALQRSSDILQEIFLYYKASATEAHADWFESLPRWQRIIHIMAVGAYLEKR